MIPWEFLRYLKILLQNNCSFKYIWGRTEHDKDFPNKTPKFRIKFYWSQSGVMTVTSPSDVSSNESFDSDSESLWLLELIKYNREARYSSECPNHICPIQEAGRPLLVFLSSMPKGQYLRQGGAWALDHSTICSLPCILVLGGIGAPHRWDNLEARALAWMFSQYPYGSGVGIPTSQETLFVRCYFAAFYRNTWYCPTQTWSHGVQDRIHFWPPHSLEKQQVRLHKGSSPMLAVYGVDVRIAWSCWAILFGSCVDRTIQRLLISIRTLRNVQCFYNAFTWLYGLLYLWYLNLTFLWGLPGCRNERAGGDTVKDLGGPYFTYFVYQSFKLPPSGVRTIRSRVKPYAMWLWLHCVTKFKGYLTSLALAVLICRFIVRSCCTKKQAKVFQQVKVVPIPFWVDHCVFSQPRFKKKLFAAKENAKQPLPTCTFSLLKLL